MRALQQPDGGILMRVAIVGAGPVGLYCAVVLARQGHRVTVIDRDPGPQDDGRWERRGVMQFHHPHFFRPQVADVFGQTAPDLWDTVVAAGGIAVAPPGAPDFVKALQCRRSTFETALWRVARAEPGVSLRTGHADGLVVERGGAAGVLADGTPVPADLVLDASGRSGRIGDGLRAPAEGGPCGFAYVSRTYRQRPGVDDLAHTTLPLGEMYDGYQVIVFPQDAGTLSALIVRPARDNALAALRHREHFEAATRAIPHLARWTDPARFEPVSDVLVGGHLTNSYRTQFDEDGAVRVPGCIAVGDAVCTTNPAAGRGISLALLQARALLELLREHGSDVESATRAFDAWCEQQIRPWFEDHVLWDATLLRRFAGQGIDVEGRIPSDVICAAADQDPEIAARVTPYQAMIAGPGVLRAVEDRARALLRDGWQPRWDDGPTRDELVDALARVPVPA